jgi:hypothetical protein
MLDERLLYTKLKIIYLNGYHLTLNQNHNTKGVGGKGVKDNIG